MTEVNPCGWLQNAGTTHTAAQLRSYIGGLTTGKAATSNTIIPRGGVNPILGSSLNVAQTGSPSMAVIISPGEAYIPGTQNSVQGCYVVQNDGDVTISLTAAHGSLARIDLIVAQVEDAFYAGSVNAWKLDNVDGTPAGSPVAPTAPANSIVLAHVAVGAGVTSVTNANITDKRFFAAGLGGMIPTKSANIPTVGTFHNGQLVFVQDSTPRRIDIVDNGAYLELSDFLGLKSKKIVKPTNETVTNSATIQSDDAFLAALEINKSYILSGVFFVTGPDGNNVGEIAIRWSFPSSTTVSWGVITPTFGLASGVLGDGSWSSTINGTSPTTILIIGTSSTIGGTSFAGSVVTGGTSGTLQLEWAQNVANGTGSTIYAGSWMKLEEA